MPDDTSTPGSLLRGIKRLVGAGVHLLLAGLFLEGITLGIQQWVSLPLSLTVETQIFMTVPCIALFLFGVIWFNRSLKLIAVHLLNRKDELITHGPFSYVRHPLYATVMITIPPLAIVWCSDLMFFVPWVLMVIVSHYIVRIEERGLILRYFPLEAPGGAVTEESNQNPGPPALGREFVISKIRRPICRQLT